MIQALSITFPIRYSHRMRMHACMHTRIPCMHTHTHECMRILVCACVLMQVSGVLATCLYQCLYTCLYIFLHTCVHTCLKAGLILDVVPVLECWSCDGFRDIRSYRWTCACVRVNKIQSARVRANLCTRVSTQLCTHMNGGGQRDFWLKLGNP